MTQQLTDITQIKDLTMVDYHKIGTAYERAGDLYMDIIRTLNEEATQKDRITRQEINLISTGSQMLCSIMGIITRCWMYQVHPQTLFELAGPYRDITNTFKLARYKKDSPLTHECIREMLKLLYQIDTFDDLGHEIAKNVRYEDIVHTLCDMRDVVIHNLWHTFENKKKNYAESNTYYNQMVEDEAVFIKKLEEELRDMGFNSITKVD